MPDTREAADTDARLVDRFREGDERAFDELVRRHRQAVYRAAWRLTGNHADADDLAQEAFVRACRSIAGFRGESQFRTWMVRIVMNLAFSNRLSRRPAVPLDEATDVQTAGGAPEAALRGELRRAVRSLPPRQRQVLVLKVYEGLKFIEIAGLTGISVGTAKATFFQAVRGLQQRMGLPRGGGRAEEDAG
jgi:RNA polymerase sigma-70 factor (ECF subfamily)